MNLRIIIGLMATHLAAIGLGFALGIYALPLLIAPPAPDAATVEQAAQGSVYRGTFSRERADSDALHWGEGDISIGPDRISFAGTLAPGPDYKLYLSPTFVETEADFERLKSSMAYVGDVKTFENFVVDVPPGVDPSQYGAVIVWCETFGQYITSATYQ